MYSLLFSDERQTFWRGNPKLGVIFLYSLTQKIKPVLFCSGSEGPMIELFNGGTNWFTSALCLKSERSKRWLVVWHCHPHQWKISFTVPETNSSHLKMVGIRLFPFGAFRPIFRCELLVSEIVYQHLPKGACWSTLWKIQFKCSSWPISISSSL